MKLRPLLSVYAVAVGIGGLIWMLLPVQSIRLYGVAAPDPIAALLGRYAGTMAVALGVMAWIARGAADSPARNALVLGITVANALGFAVCLFGALTEELNAAKWVPVTSYAVFTLLFVLAGRASMADKAAG
jgi:hypothetical protein